MKFSFCFLIFVLHCLRCGTVKDKHKQGQSSVRHHVLFVIACEGLSQRWVGRGRLLMTSAPQSGILLTKSLYYLPFSRMV